MSRLARCYALLAISLAAASAPPAWAGWISYDASLGTLPEAQGFLFNTSGDSQLPSVSGGLLHQGPTVGGCTTGGYQFWYRDNAAISFSTGVEFDASIRIVSSSDFHALPCADDAWKAGYGITVTDTAGRMFFVGITSDGVFLANNNICAPGMFPRLLVNTKDAVHHYRLRVVANMATLYFDDTPLTSLAMGVMVNPGGENQVAFGDVTHAGSNQSHMASFGYTIDGVTAVDGQQSLLSGLSLMLVPQGAAHKIRYSLPVRAQTRLRIFDASGRVVAKVADDDEPAGSHEAVWRHTNDDGHLANPGVYFVDLESGGRRAHGKLVVLR